MIQDLEKLIELQEIDLTIHELRVSSQEFPQKVRELESAIEQASASADTLRARIEALGVEKSDLETKIQENRALLDRSQERLNSITTNREYDAVHSEIEAQKQLVERSAGRISDIGKECERLEEELVAATGELERITEENTPPIAELKEKIATIDSRIAEQVARRNAVIAQTGKGAVRTYEYILKGRKNARVISRAGKNSRICSVCFKVLEPQLVNELRRANRVIICQSCGSILIWEEPTQEEIDAEA